MHTQINIQICGQMTLFPYKSLMALVDLSHCYKQISKMVLNHLNIPIQILLFTP